MKELIKNSVLGLLLVPVMALGVVATVPAASAHADTVTCPSDPTQDPLKSGADCTKGNGTPDQVWGKGGVFTTITNVLLLLIGAVAVIMLIIGGIRYTISGGDSAAVTSAKNTILYAIVGIVVAILAYAIVNFVITSFVGGGSTN